MLDLNVVKLFPQALAYLPRWCCSGPTWWSETIPPHCCRKRSCCTTSAPAAQGLRSGKAALWRWSAWSLSPLLFSDSPLWPEKNKKAKHLQDVQWSSAGQHGSGQVFTLIWHFVRGEKPSCPGFQLSISLLGCVSITTTSDTGLGATGKHCKKKKNTS